MNGEDDSGSHKVELYIYDLSRGFAKPITTAFLGKQLEGIWHTGIVAYGREYFYGGEGTDNCRPGGTILGQPDKIEVLGESQVPYQLFLEYVFGLGESTYTPGTYDLFKHNCNNFSEELSQFLCGRAIPKYILDLPDEFLNTESQKILGQIAKDLKLKNKITKTNNLHVDPLPARRTENDPELEILEQAIEEVRQNTLLLENRRNSLNEKLLKKEKKDKKREKKEKKRLKKQAEAVGSCSLQKKRSSNSESADRKEILDLCNLSRRSSEPLAKAEFQSTSAGVATASSAENCGLEVATDVRRHSLPLASESSPLTMENFESTEAQVSQGNIVGDQEVDDSPYEREPPILYKEEIDVSRTVKSRSCNAFMDSTLLRHLPTWLTRSYSEDDLSSLSSYSSSSTSSLSSSSSYLSCSSSSSASSQQSLHVVPIQIPSQLNNVPDSFHSNDQVELNNNPSNFSNSIGDEHIAAIPNRLPPPYYSKHSVNNSEFNSAENKDTGYVSRETPVECSLPVGYETSPRLVYFINKYSSKTNQAMNLGSNGHSETTELFHSKVNSNQYCALDEKKLHFTQQNVLDAVVINDRQMNRNRFQKPFYKGNAQRLVIASPIPEETSSLLSRSSTVSSLSSDLSFGSSYYTHYVVDQGYINDLNDNLFPHPTSVSRSQSLSSVSSFETLRTITPEPEYFEEQTRMFNAMRNKSPDSVISRTLSPNSIDAIDNYIFEDASNEWYRLHGSSENNTLLSRPRSLSPPRAYSPPQIIRRAFSFATFSTTLDSCNTATLDESMSAEERNLLDPLPTNIPNTNSPLINHSTLPNLSPGGSPLGSNASLVPRLSSHSASSSALSEPEFSVLCYLGPARPHETPVVFPDIKIQGKVEFDGFVGCCVDMLSREEQQHMEELREYVIEDEGSWAISENFSLFFARVFHDPAIPMAAKCHLVRVMAMAALKDDVILILHQDRREHSIMNFANKVESLPEDVQEALALFFCNMFEHLSPSEWLLYISEWTEGSQTVSNIRVTTKVAVNAVLHHSPKVQEYGTALMYNLGTKEVKTVVFDDVAPELAMAILQFLNNRPSEEFLWRSLAALCRFCYASSEVPALIKMIGPDPTEFRGISDRVDSVIEEILAKLSRARMF